MFGCDVAGLISAPLERLIPTRYRDQHRNDVQRFGSSNEATRQIGRQRDVMGLRSNGEEFPLDAAISHLNFGGVHLYTAILRDISEQRRAQAALRESEESLRRVLVNLPEAVFINSGDRFSFVNEAAKRLFGGDEAGLIGLSPSRLIYPDSIPLVRSRIVALRGGAPAAPLTQVKIVRVDGAVRLVESAATMFDEHVVRSSS